MKNKTSLSSNQTNILLTILFLSLALVFTIGVNNVSAASGDTIYVSDSGGNDDYDGSSWYLAKKTIKNATGTVNDNGRVNIAAGKYTGIDNTQITINKNMTINGESKKTTIINGTSNNWIFHIQNGINLTITNLTLTKGTTSYGGGAIDNKGSLIVNNSNFIDNSATFAGGAIYNYGGTLIIMDSNFRGNTANYYGGAIFNQDGVLTINNSIFTDNTADNGGAYFNYGTLTITGTTFRGNSANDYGGAIISEYGVLTINSSNFIGNTAEAGGAIYNYGTLIVTSSTFYGNNAANYGGDYGGGAIYNYHGTSDVSFCRIVRNTPNDIQINGGVCVFDYNWWGSNFYGANPIIKGRLVGATVYKWLVLTSKAYPSTIYEGETSKIIADILHDQNGVYQDLANGHVPDGIPVVFNTDLGNISSKTTTNNGVVIATLTEEETEGIAHVNVVSDAQTVNVEVTIKDKFSQSNLYLRVTPNKNNPTISETVIYTLKVGNKGPDTAKNVVMTYTIPDGLEFAGATVDNGTYKFDPNTRTIIWTIGDVPVGDPNMDLSLRIVETGQYFINPKLKTSTNDPRLNQNIQSITVNASNYVPINPVEAVNISMQNTGVPIVGIVLAILIVLGGLISTQKNNK